MGSEPTPCGLCEDPENDEMVQCDHCDVWFHFICVGVDQSIQDFDWMCWKCNEKFTRMKNQQQAQSITMKDATGKQPLSPNNRSKIPNATKKKLFMSPLKKITNTDEGNKNASMEEQFQSPYNQDDDKMSKVSVGYTDRAHSVCSKKSKRNLEMKLQQLEEEHKIKMEYMQRKFEIMAAQDSDSEEEDVDGACGGMEVNVDGQNIKGTACRNNLSKEDSNVRQVRQAMTQTYVNSNMQQRPQRMPNQNLLSQEQVYSRQIIPRELPFFSGKSEEWPLFISSYENSTALCGFNNNENLLRLQRALKGRALDFVGSKLTLPGLVPEVISTLRMLFGRPENIIQNLLTKLRAGSPVNPNKLDTLIHFSLDVKNIVATMEAAKLWNHLNNPMLIQEFIERIPAQMRLDWAIYAKRLQQPNLRDFSNWLFNLAEAASSVITVLTPGSNHQEEKRKGARVNMHEERTDHGRRNPKKPAEMRCFACEEVDHFIVNCEKFKKLPYDEKWNMIRERKICRSCLKVHDPKFCRERKECGINNCTAKHHRYLHKPDNPSETHSPSPIVAVHSMATSNILYRIIPITLHGKNKSITEYALLDEASGPTLIEKSILTKLGIHGEKSELCVRWTDGTLRVEKDSEEVNLNVSPSGNSNRKFLLKNVRSVDLLDLPKQTLIFSELKEKYKHLQGIPVKSYENVTPRIIIGLNNKSVAIPLKSKEGKDNEPAALKCRLGWTVYGLRGPDVDDALCVNLQLHICECDDDIALDKLMRQSFEIENEVDKIHDVNSNEDSMKNYVVRTDNKYTVKLLWKSENITMPDNYNMAFRRLLCFERKLEKDEDLKNRVNEHIQQMLSKGYIRMLTKSEISKPYQRKWYLPIFVVRNPNKPQKVRIVWDAAAEYLGVSLNSCIDKGPDLLTPLLKVLFNFRIGKIAINGDIMEMFHRVGVDETDIHSQRFICRNCDNKANIDTYVLQVMSFGASCSPSLAQYVKNSNAKEFEKEFPRAAKSILERHYVDDMLDSVDTVEEAILLAQQVREIHQRGNFVIRNWMSNSNEVLAALGEEKSIKTFCHAGKRVEQVVEPDKVLGMWWRTSDDVFTFNLKYTKATTEILAGLRLPTKRELLRLLMSIFDPMGLMSFYTIQMKILMQNVWRQNITWDDAIPEEFSDEWLRWLSILKNVENLNVPRCYFQRGTSKDSKIQLHVFVDASENAYAAVAYFRIQSQNGIETALVAAKTKVAPLRPISIPRLELLAAVLGSRLAVTIKNSHDFEIEATYLWSDSKTVLLWLKEDPKRYKQFVMFRVAEIQEISSISSWRYVPTKLNVADLATKWVKQLSFDKSSPWFTGPSFLCQSTIH